MTKVHQSAIMMSYIKNPETTKRPAAKNPGGDDNETTGRNKARRGGYDDRRCGGQACSPGKFIGQQQIEISDLLRAVSTASKKREQLEISL